MSMRYPEKIHGLMEEIALYAAIDLDAACNGRTCDYRGLKDLIATLEVNLARIGQGNDCSDGPLDVSDLVLFARVFGFPENIKLKTASDVYDQIRDVHHDLKNIYEDFLSNRRIPPGEIKEAKDLCLKISKMNWEHQKFGPYRLVG